MVTRITALLLGVTLGTSSIVSPAGTSADALIQEEVQRATQQWNLTQAGQSTLDNTKLTTLVAIPMTETAAESETDVSGEAVDQQSGGSSSQAAGQPSGPTSESSGGSVEADTAVEATKAEQDAETEAEENDEYADLAIADVDHYVNVRSEPNTDSSIVGKIYAGAVAQVLAIVGEENDWFQITSGSVEGYIKAEYFLYGDAAAEVIDEYVTRVATVEVDRLNVRKEPSTDAKRIGYVDLGESVEVIEDLGEWLKVSYAGEKTGYIAAEYVTVSEEFTYAKSLEEEAAEQAAQRAQEAREAVSEETAAENTTSVVVTDVTTDYSTVSEERTAIVEYAMQYLGNKYVHGGNSLESGTDCSGFTSLIYAAFGYSISRTPSGQLSSNGTSISYSEIQPGDIICYGKSKCTHVALYIGDGQIIHEANSRKGVIISDAGYDTILGVKSILN